MRLTWVARMPQRIQRLRDAQWNSWRKPSIMDLGTEKKLKEQGIEVVDAKEFVREMDNDLYPPEWRNLPDAKPVFPQPPANDRSHPHWHDTPVLMFDSTNFVMEGVNQAMAFTKSVQVKEGLPDTLLEISQQPFKYEDEVEKVVKQGFLWDAYMEKLPYLKNFDYPTRRFRVQLGIPARRSNDILIRNFLRLIEQDNPEMAMSRMISNDEDFRVNLVRHGYPVQIKLSPLLNIMAKTPVLPFSKPEEIAQTESQPIPDIFPFLSTANFDDKNIYEEGDFFSVTPGSAFPNIHTAVFSHHIAGSHTHIHPRWNDDRFAGTTVMYAFATALLMAKRKFGDVSAILPEPVTAQVVHSTGKELQFAVFQLNTVDFEESATSKVKNILWLTQKINLFSHIENKLGTELFEGYSPEAFKIFKGMYLSPTM